MRTLSSEAVTENADELAQLLTEAGVPPEEPKPIKSAEPESPPTFEPLVPLDRTGENLPKFPENALPDVLWGVSATIADSVEADIALAAVPALVNCSVAIGNTFRVQVKPGYTEPLNLYAVTAANSAESKSSVTSPLNQPLYDFQTEWNNNQAPIVDAWNDTVNILTKRIENLKRESASSKIKPEDKRRLDSDLKKAREDLQDKLSRPEQPLRIVAQDATPEVVGKLLQENDGTLSIISDEGGILETLTGKQYAKESGAVNIEVLLKAYSGTPLVTDRITRDKVIVNNPCLTINITAQPVTVRDLVSSSIFTRRGFTARFLYAFPRKRAGTRTGDAPEPFLPAVDEYNTLIKDLLNIRQNSRRENPRIIRFSKDAYRNTYLPLFRAKEAELNSLDENANANLYSWVSRMHGHAVRIAGLIHAIEHGEQADVVELSPETFQRATRIVEYFRSHAEHAFSLNEGIEGGTEGRARYIWKALTDFKASTGANAISKHQLLRKCQRLTAETMQPALTLLESWGHISVEEETKGRGRPKETIYINPDALARYRIRTDQDTQSAEK